MTRALRCQATADCDRETTVGNLCTAHYAQQRRGQELRPLRTNNNTAQVTFRCSKALRRAAERAAAFEGISPAEWWRRTGRKAL